MKEKLVCNNCGMEYTDEKSIETAKKMKTSWIEICRADGKEPKGIAPCPNMTCKGELILEK